MEFPEPHKDLQKSQQDSPIAIDYRTIISNKDSPKTQQDAPEKEFGMNLNQKNYRICLSMTIASHIPSQFQIRHLELDI